MFRKDVLTWGKTRKTCKSDEFLLRIFSVETRLISRFWIGIHEGDPTKTSSEKMFLARGKLEKHVNQTSFY
jgi:hypothetical protein